MESKQKIIIINVISIIMLAVCLILCVVLVLISNSKSNVKISEKSVDELPQNYTLTEETSSANTWDISATENDDVIATLSDDGILTISGTGNMKNWNSSATRDWYEMKDKVKTVIIENGVNNIGDCAFLYCRNLTSVEIAESVTSIGRRAFEMSYLLNYIEIPGSVTSIGDTAFTNCYGLDYIEVDKSNPNYIDVNGVLYSKDKKEILQYPIGKNEEKYEIPNGTIAIGKSAFYAAQLTNIEIPESVKSIGNKAFDECIYLTNINVNEKNTDIKDYNGILYTKDGKEVIKYPQGKYDTEYEILNGTTKIRNGAFYNCTCLVKVEIPDSVTVIEDRAFKLCINLTEMKIPDSVISIGNEAFQDCTITILTDIKNDIEMPNILKRTRDKNDLLYSSSGLVFNNCTIDENKIKIEEGMYEASVKVKDGVLRGMRYYYYVAPISWDVSVNADKSVMASLSKDGTLTISGNGAMKDYEWHDKKINSIMGNLIKKVIIEEGVTNIGDYAFAMSEPDIQVVGEPQINGWPNCITSIEIAESVTSIGECAFFGCTSLTNIKIPESVTIIGYVSLVACPNLTSIEVDENNTNYKDINGVLYTKDGTILIKYPEGRNEGYYSIQDGTRIIEEGAFAYCYNLNTIQMNNNLTEIRYGAFLLCENLTSIVIPESLISIEYEAFYGCSELTIIGRKDSVAQTYARENEIDYLIIMDGIKPKTTVTLLIQNLENEEEYEIKNKNGEIIANTAYLTTWTIVEMKDGENYIIIVTGDCNGDGKSDIQDIFAINKHRLNNGKLTNEYLLAGDANRDGKTNINDIFEINKYRLGIKTEL